VRRTRTSHWRPASLGWAGLRCFVRCDDESGHGFGSFSCGIRGNTKSAGQSGMCLTIQEDNAVHPIPKIRNVAAAMHTTRIISSVQPDTEKPDQGIWTPLQVCSSDTRPGHRSDTPLTGLKPGCPSTWGNCKSGDWLPCRYNAGRGQALPNENTSSSD